MPKFSSFISSIMSKPGNETYTALSFDEPGDDAPLQSGTDKDEFSIGINTNKEYRGLIKQLLLIICLSVLFTVAALTIIVTTSSAKCQTTSVEMSQSMSTGATQPFMKPQPEISSLTAKDCGNNPKTARERGCHFDIMSMIWIPHECYDPDLTEEFASERSWEWSLHENGTDPISEDVIRTGDIQNGWVQFEYHLTHCLYTWKKVIKQVERGGAPIDGYVSNHTHTEHCSYMLSLRSIPAERWNTPFVVLYPTCYV